MKKHFFVFLMVAIAFSGCRKQVSDYERPDFDPQPTLNAVLQEGQPVWAQVTFAQGLDSVRPSACTDAEVLLYVDGQFAEKLQHEGDGLYVGETTAEALHEYACQVVIPGYDTLFAQTEMPEKPVVTGVEIMENATVDDEGRPCPAFLITFRTDPNRNLYYSLNIYADFLNEYYDAETHAYLGHSTESGTMSASINTDDPVLLNEGYTPNYQIVLDRERNTDTFDVYVEVAPDQFSDLMSQIQKMEKSLESALRTMLGISPKVHLVAPKTITRSEGKAVRVSDKRKLH